VPAVGKKPQRQRGGWCLSWEFGYSDQLWITPALTRAKQARLTPPDGGRICQRFGLPQRQRGGFESQLSTPLARSCGWPPGELAQGSWPSTAGCAACPTVPDLRRLPQ